MKSLMPVIVAVSVAMGAMVEPLPELVDYDKAKAVLGQQLFHDARLSKDGTVSCSSCHILEYNGADGGEVSVGVGGALGTINAPTVYNARYNLAQFWDGHAKDLKEQALGPMANPVEMANDYETVVQTISADATYDKAFKALYADGVTLDNIVDAIAEFELALITPNSRFDRYLKGDAKAISDIEIEGFELFKTRGCIACHNGINIGGNMYQKFGVFFQYEGKRGNLGRYNVTQKEEDKYFFKVPSLRNVALTAPYFHDGSAPTLESAVEQMAYYQLGYRISKAETERIVAFLKTLNGELPEIVRRKE